jgi:hypothetical protein
MTSTLRTVFTATRAALLVVSASLPAQAANEVAHRGTSVYDGAWSIVIQTTHAIVRPPCGLACTFPPAAC